VLIQQQDQPFPQNMNYVVNKDNFINEELYLININTSQKELKNVLWDKFYAINA
jgi:hypothetical protein